MHTVFRLFLVLVFAAFLVGCGTYSRTITYGPPPVPEPPAAPKMEPPAPPPVPELPAASTMEPPTPPSPGLLPMPELSGVDGSGKAVFDSSTLTVTLGEHTWEIFITPRGVQPFVVLEFSFEQR